MGKYIIEVDESEIVKCWNEQVAKEIGYQEYALKQCPKIKVKPYNPSGDCINREALLNEFDSKCQRMCPTCEYHKWNSKLKRYECELINTAPPVEPRIEYGTDGHPYKLSMTNGKEYERTKDDWRDNLIEVFRHSAEVGSDTFHLFEIERIINGEPI